MDNPDALACAPGEDFGEEARTRELTHRIIGAAMRVHSELGPGFAEPVYQHALAIEFEERAIPYVRERELPVYYRDRQLPCVYRADFICLDVLVELKALSRVGNTERAQVMNYLKATGMARGLILNFGTERLEYKRVIWSPHLRSSAPSADRSKGV